MYPTENNLNEDYITINEQLMQCRKYALLIKTEFVVSIKGANKKMRRVKRSSLTTLIITIDGYG